MITNVGPILYWMSWCCTASTLAWSQGMSSIQQSIPCRFFRVKIPVFVQSSVSSPWVSTKEISVQYRRVDGTNSQYAVMPNKYYYMGVFFLLGKRTFFHPHNSSITTNASLIYLIIVNLNCLLASLNARTALRDQMCLPPTFMSKIFRDEEDHARSPPSVRLTHPVPRWSSAESLILSLGYLFHSCWSESLLSQKKIGIPSKLSLRMWLLLYNPVHGLVTIDHDAWFMHHFRVGTNCLLCSARS